MNRLSDAKKKREEAEIVLAQYTGPGGGTSRYDTPEAAKEARKKYLKAYGSLYVIRPERRAKQREKSARKRQRVRGAAPQFYRHMLLAPEAWCYWCAKSLTVAERFGDHRIPLAKGGEHSEANLVISCGPCNQSKSAKMPDKFISERWGKQRDRRGQMLLGFLPEAICHASLSI